MIIDDYKVVVEVELRAVPVDSRVYAKYVLVSDKPAMLTWPLRLICWN
jgi:hypothetical protein